MMNCHDDACPVRGGRLLMSVISLIPLGLTVLRATLAPVMIFLATDYPNRAAFAACLVAAFVSDVFDGIIARRLKVATPGLRRLDSFADALFYLAAVFAAWRLYPEVIRAHQLALTLLFSLEIARLLFDLIKFGREASYHMWSSKLWGIALFVAFMSLLAFGQAGLLISIAIYLGIAADIEGLTISIVLRQWRTDVPSFVHAFRQRGQSSG